MVGGVDGVGGVGSADGGSKLYGSDYAAKVQENTMRIVGAMSDAMGVSGNSLDEVLGQLADKLGMDKGTLGMMVAAAADPNDKNSKLAGDVLGMLMEFKGYSNPFSSGQ